MSRRILPILSALCLLSTQSWGNSTVRKAPEFKVSMLDGSKISLSQYHGKVVVLAMIMTTCPHCQAATRTLGALQREFGPRGLQVIEAALDQTPAQSIPVFLKNFSPPFPVGYTTTTDSVLFMRLSTTKRYFVPYVTFIGRDGMIHGQYVGDDSFNDEKDQAQNFRNLVVKLIGGKESAKK